MPCSAMLLSSTICAQYFRVVAAIMIIFFATLLHYTEMDNHVKVENLTMAQVLLCVACARPCLCSCTPSANLTGSCQYSRTLHIYVTLFESFVQPQENCEGCGRRTKAVVLAPIVAMLVRFFSSSKVVFSTVVKLEC